MYRDRSEKQPIGVGPKPPLGSLGRKKPRGLSLEIFQWQIRFKDRNQKRSSYWKQVCNRTFWANHEFWVQQGTFHCSYVCRGTKNFTLSYRTIKKGPETIFVRGTFEDPRKTVMTSTGLAYNTTPQVYTGFKPFTARYFKFSAKTYYGGGAALKFILVL